MKPSSQRILPVSQREALWFSQLVKEKAVVTTALCCPSANSNEARGKVCVGGNMGRKSVKYFFLDIYWLQVFYVRIFEISFSLQSVLICQLLLAAPSYFLLLEIVVAFIWAEKQIA